MSNGTREYTLLRNLQLFNTTSNYVKHHSPWAVRHERSQGVKPRNSKLNTPSYESTVCINNESGVFEYLVLKNFEKGTFVPHTTNPKPRVTYVHTYEHMNIYM